MPRLSRARSVAPKIAAARSRSPPPPTPQRRRPQTGDPGQSALRPSGGRSSTSARRSEGEEERVTLRVDLHAAVTPEGLPEHVTVLGQDVRIAHHRTVVPRAQGVTTTLRGAE